MNAREWLNGYAARIGVDPPTDDELKQLLDLAAEAAHSSERIAAPVACWLSARAGLEPADALGPAREVAGGEEA
ncbi:MAG: DUF6457 domain-containing protein [Solirubrobacterales bacterium]